MANKPTLFYTLVRQWHVGGFKVMRVTTEKSRQLYGSFTDEDMPTHCSPRQTIGRFETAEQAQSKIDGVAEIRARYAPGLKRLRDAEREMEEDQRHEIEKFIMAPATPLQLMELSHGK
jgi:hypothetical protein